MSKIILPIFVITASALYLRHCIKDGCRPPTDVARHVVYHDPDSDEDWDLGPEDSLDFEQQL
jgi:hypothetical protein